MIQWQDEHFQACAKLRASPEPSKPQANFSESYEEEKRWEGPVSWFNSSGAT